MKTLDNRLLRLNFVENYDRRGDSWRRASAGTVTNLLDIRTLGSIKTELIWGYKIERQAAEKFDVRLTQRTLYSLVNSSEKGSFLTGEKHSKSEETTKVYVRTGRTMLSGIM